MAVDYFIYALISFLGIFLGVYLAKNSPEELKPFNKKMDILFEIISYIYFILFFMYILNIYFSLVIFIISLPLFFVVRKNKFKTKILFVFSILFGITYSLYAPLFSSLLFLLFSINSIDKLKKYEKGEKINKKYLFLLKDVVKKGYLFIILMFLSYFLTLISF